MMNIKIATSTITIAFLLSGCGGGGGSAAPAAAPVAVPKAPAAAPVAVPKAAAVPTLSYTPVKGFKFNWPDVSDATYYKILENKNGTSGFSKIGNDIAQGVGTTTQTVPLHKRLNAQYILQSCTTAGCIDSAAISVTGTLVDSIGYVKASNTAKDDYFGSSISLSSDESTLAVGAPGVDNSALVTDSGAVYIFTRAGSMWKEEAFLTAGIPTKDSEFGNSVSLSSDGNTLAVGESKYDRNTTETDSGAVYIFTRTGSTWSQQISLSTANPQKGDSFGYSVSLSGDGNTVAIGAIGDDTGGVRSGAVYILTRTNSGWDDSQTIYASIKNTGDFFGFSVSLNSDGATLAVAAPLSDNGSVTNSGAAYIFTRTGTGTNLQQQQKVVATSQGNTDLFGTSVSLSGDGNTLAVGAMGEESSAVGVGGDQNDNNASGSGAAYIFNRAGTAWSQLAYVKASNTQASDYFGTSVSLSGDGNTLAVAARGEGSNTKGLRGDESDNTAGSSGAVYTFSLTGSTWTQQAYVKASNTQASDYFGRSVSLSGDGATLAVGASVEGSSAKGIDGDASDNSAIGSGAVYLY